LAHDCQLGSHIIMANLAQLAGHVHLGDWVFVGGQSGIHQFVRVGAHAMTGFQTRLSQDVPPFVTVAGSPAAAQGVNQEGLRRRGFSPERISLIKKMHRLLYRENLTLQASREAIGAMGKGEATVAGAEADVTAMLEFLGRAERGIVR
ncbi:MAG: acyl-[acyl-carrier-protein]--UDP-N-acetylglucosamine O-acyltransferase, partial [Burkholderiales bacterium]